MSELQIYQAINAVSQKVNDINHRLDSMTNSKIDALTPYKESKTAYIEDTEVTFTSVPSGNLSVFVVDSEGNYPNYIVDRVTDRVTVSFDPCQYITTVTISIL